MANLHSAADLPLFYSTVALVLPVLQLSLFVGRERIWRAQSGPDMQRRFNQTALLYLGTGTAAEVAALVGLLIGGNFVTAMVSLIGGATNLFMWTLAVGMALFRFEPSD